MDALEFRFAFFARDFEKSIAFYRDVLGMQPAGQWWDRPDGKGALLSAGGRAVIEIYGAADGQTYSGPSSVAINLALRLEDAPAVDAFYARLVAQGLPGLEVPQDRAMGTSLVHRP